MATTGHDEQDDGGTGWGTGLLLAVFLLLIVGAGLRVLPGWFMTGHRRHPHITCVSNLKQIEGAKEQWALENKKSVGTVPDQREVSAYLKNSVMPQCPTKGIYRLNPVGVTPTCSRGAAEGHTI